MQNNIEDSTRPVKNTKFTTTLLPDGNWVFFDAENNQVVVTSPTAGIFWEMCTGELVISEIVEEIAKLYPTQDIETIRGDIRAILPKLLQEELLTSK